MNQDCHPFGSGGFRNSHGGSEEQPMRIMGRPTNNTRGDSKNERCRLSVHCVIPYDTKPYLHIRVDRE